MGTLKGNGVLKISRAFCGFLKQNTIYLIIELPAIHAVLQAF